jgi:uncharacterized damage-inducible protein DinB
MKTIRIMFEHLNWANCRILKTLQTTDGENQKQAIRLFSHILFAEHVWFTRINRINSTKLPIWADVDLEACVDLVEQNNKNFKEFLTTKSDMKLDQFVSYKNSTGKEFSNSLRDILTHVALHGQYHRGQINLLLRVDGMEPINTDFITFRR